MVFEYLKKITGKQDSKEEKHKSAASSSHVSGASGSN